MQSKLFKNIEREGYMSDHILLFDKDIEGFCLDNSTENRFELSKINIFVGANNSGKSRFIRKLAAMKHLRKACNAMQADDFKKIMFELEKNISEFRADNEDEYGSNHGLLYEELRAINILKRGLTSNDKETVFDIELAKILIRSIMQEGYLAQKGYDNLDSMDNFLIRCNNVYQELVEFDNATKLIINNRVYIPTLRGLRGFNITLNDILADEVIQLIHSSQNIDRNLPREIEEDVFLRRTRNDYFNESDNYLFNIEKKDVQWDKLIYQLIFDKSNAISYIKDKLYKTKVHEVKGGQIGYKLKDFLLKFENSINDRDDFDISNIQPTFSDKQLIIYVFNKILEDETLYNEKVFAKINLNMELKHLLRQGIKAENIIRFNRLLLESIFSTVISRSEVEIVTGLGFYDEIKDMLLGTQKDRDTIKKFEEFLRENFFDNQLVTIIPRKDDDVLFVKIGEMEEREIYNLGDGIQSIIIQTFPMFKYKDQTCWFFIEEPELYLHPAFQRILIDTMLNEERDHKFFITTHSNHLLDLTFDEKDISIFSMSLNSKNTSQNSMNQDFIIEPVSLGNDSVLKNLGVRDSSVFLSNCTIWVEGITDIYYVRKYLELYQNKNLGNKVFKENIHFSFIEYGGNNITHWSFLEKEENPISYERISKNIFVVVDRDDYREEKERGGKSTEKEKRIDDLIKKFGDEQFRLLPAREIENLIHPEVLYNVLKEYEGENIEVKNPEEGRANKSLLASDLEYDEYKMRPLGEYIEEVVDVNKKYDTNPDKKGSGTIERKRDFCEKAIKHTTFETMTDDAKDLARRVYEFIARFN